MVEKELALKEAQIIESGPLTKEEFNRRLYYDDSADKSLLETFADTYDKLPSVIKALKNFDPVMGAISDILAENKEKRNTERLSETLYQFYIAIWQLDQRVKNNTIDVEYVKQQLPALSEVYLDYSMKTYQLEKIEYFRNILVNGSTDYDSEFDEKVNIFDIISSLTIREIRILEYLHYRSTEQGTMMRIVELSQALGIIDYIYLAQLCDNLVGKGLLLRVTDSGAFEANGKTKGYEKADYALRLIKYIEAYSK